ncbi:MAG TPA: MBL fold metallo-hydrolase, partial [Myxococcota bacterium]|nr:MBL fold metallo-hydrolase [Myxococcota bacterium]
MRYWGVRGSTQVPGRGTLRYGGNTTCIEVRCDDTSIIIDAGTGLRALGASMPRDVPVRAALLFTHFHLDHVAGLPFFAPIFRRDCALTLISDPAVGGGARTALPRLMSAPLFPVEFAALPSALGFVDATPGRPVEVGGAMVSFAPLHHPGGASGLRIEHRGRTFVHLSDLEHTAAAPADNLVAFAQECDAL